MLRHRVHCLRLGPSGEEFMIQGLRRVAAALVCATVALLQGSTLLAQVPKDLPPDAAAELARSPKPPLPNQVVGVNINRFVGSPLLSPCV